MKLKFFKNSNSRAGFTIAELMVSIGLFVILTGIASGGFIQAMRNQRMATALMSVNDSMSTTLEQMAREIRTGYNFCTKASPINSECSSLGDQEIQFVNSKNEIVRYRVDNINNSGIIERGISASAACQGIQVNDFCFNAITADDVDIKNFNLNLIGNNVNGMADGLSPRITIAVGFSSTSPDIKKQNIIVNIQTTISARNMDT